MVGMDIASTCTSRSAGKAAEEKAKEHVISNDQDDARMQRDAMRKVSERDMHNSAPSCAGT